MKTECSAAARNWGAENYYPVIISPDYGSISETIYTLLIKLAPARSVEIEEGSKEEYRTIGGEARKHVKGQDRIDVPTVMELSEQCRARFSTRFHSVIRILSIPYIIFAHARARVYVGYSLSVIILA